MATPLTLLLTKDHFEWTSAAQLAFENLKIAISIAPVLSLPNFCLPIVLEMAKMSVRSPFYHSQGSSKLKGVDDAGGTDTRTTIVLSSAHWL